MVATIPGGSNDFTLRDLVSTQLVRYIDKEYAISPPSWSVRLANK